MHGGWSSRVSTQDVTWQEEKTTKKKRYSRGVFFWFDIRERTIMDKGIQLLMIPWWDSIDLHWCKHQLFVPSQSAGKWDLQRIADCSWWKMTSIEDLRCQARIHCKKYRCLEENWLLVGLVLGQKHHKLGLARFKTQDKKKYMSDHSRIIERKLLFILCWHTKETEALIDEMKVGSSKRKECC